MSDLIEHLELGLDEDLEAHLKAKHPSMQSYRILRKSVDARRRPPKFIYRVEIFNENEEIPSDTEVLQKIPENFGQESVIIVGAGPAGLFAAIRLAERGIKSMLFERGSKTAARLQAISQYWRYGKINPDDNVCYGEGGAGLYSDGKLITRIKSPYIPYVLDRLVKFGAPEEIKYLANPHVGSDKIRKLIPPIREFLLSNGCEIFFNTKVEKIIFENGRCKGIQTKDGINFQSSHVILATGHSAVDIYEELEKSGVAMEGKSFAIGLRVEHPQIEVNQIQYKDYAAHPALGAANYKLSTYDESTGIGVYSFCMCPGGYVINSSTDERGLVSNGMSNYARNSAWANSALVVSVDYKNYFGTELFAGLKFIQSIETRAKNAVVKAGGQQQLPGQKLSDFLQRRKGELLSNSCPSKAIPIGVHDLLPSEIYTRLTNALHQFQRQMSGFISDKAQVFGVETRTSAPVRIIRGAEDFQSISHPGLYPCGEGAGYAGGITSAAVDGVRVAESIYRQMA